MTITMTKPEVEEFTFEECDFKMEMPVSEIKITVPKVEIKAKPKFSFADLVAKDHLFANPWLTPNLTPDSTLPKRPSLSLEALMEAVHAVVSEAGEWHCYERGAGADPCYTGDYVRNGKPDCLFGRVFHRLGMSIGELRDNEGSTAGKVADGKWHIGHDMGMVLSMAQQYQDQGSPWGLIERSMERNFRNLRACG